MTPEPQSEKHVLRRQFSAARRDMADREREAARTAIRSYVLKRAHGSGWRVVAAYVPLRTEPGSLELLDGLQALGCRVLVPITLPDRDLDWAPWPPASPPVTLGTDAVREADLVLVPALAVAADGTRLGRGGGSYDRALARLTRATVSAALVFDDEIVARLPRDAWDVSVTAAVSPRGWTPLRRNTGTEPGG